jgi:predicted Holliday junction resolvase-like endonuclease
VEIVISLIAAHACILIFFLWRRDKAKYEESLESAEAQVRKVVSQKKSSEVRTGQIAEHFVPLLKDFKYNRKQARFLATPIDFIIFEDDEIIFMEVKTGNSQLTATQRKVRDLIKEKKVKWEVLRIK